MLLVCLLWLHWHEGFNPRHSQQNMDCRYVLAWRIQALVRLQSRYSILTPQFMVSHEVPPHKFVIRDASNMSSHFKQLFLEDNTAMRLLAVFIEIQEWSTQSVFSVIIPLGGYILIWVYICGWHGTWWQQQWPRPNTCTERRLKADLILYMICATDTHK